MLSDAALYQSAAHPDKVRLLFTAQLHQALKNIAKNREIVPVTPNATSALRPVVSLHDPYGSSSPFGRTTELNGWDLEKKMVALQDVCELLQRPFFFYADWATHAGATAKSAPASIEKRVNALLYSSKLLPLRLGQTTLLDLWEYVMDMCDHVPVRNRCRALYLHVASCICRRVEFIEDYELDGEHVHVDAQVSERYHKLLLRCVQFSAVKLAKSRFVADDHKAFIAHMYTALFFRFPCTTAKLLSAVLDTTATLERRNEDDDDDDDAEGGNKRGPEGDNANRTPPTSPTTTTALPRLHVSNALNGGVRRRPHRKSTLRGYRSPRGHCRHWNALVNADNDSGSDVSNADDASKHRAAEHAESERHDSDSYDDDRAHRIVRAKQKTFEAFVAYKTSRGTDDLLSTNSSRGSSYATFKRGARSAEASLELAFQQTMDAASEQRECKFFDQLPLLYMGNVTEREALAAVGVSRAELFDEVLEPFLDRLTTPGRDDLTAVTFVAAFLRDVSTWCAHRRDSVASAQPESNNNNNNNNNNNSSSSGHAGDILWHCIPGYFALVRLFLAVFQLMCQRRPRMAAMPAAPASVGRILSIVDGTSARGHDDPWLAYWTGREVEIVLDAAGEVLQNEYLVNVLVKVVLETTNMHDPMSVNYSFGILQRVLEVAAKSASSRAAVATTMPTPLASASASNSSASAARANHRLSSKFDVEYFMGVMRRALQSAHVQILLKVLTCLYNSVDLLPPNVRQRIIGELILRENFFRFFMHWNEEIRKIFSYIIVFKTSQSNRLDLPCATDRILLAQSAYFEAPSGAFALASLSPSTSSSTASSPLSTASSPQPSPSSFSYWTQLSDMAQSMLRAGGAGAGSGAGGATEAEKAGASALKRLVAWDCSARLRKNRGGARDVLFRDSLESDELSVDLSIGSKLDALFKMIADQMNAHRSYFPRVLEAYVERGLAQYVAVLFEYYDAASASVSAPPSAPTLAFTITTPVFTD